MILKEELLSRGVSGFSRSGLPGGGDISRVQGVKEMELTKAKRGRAKFREQKC
ncbi:MULTISPECIES: hypothetical protein [unclassified Lelliottia]|uniref:hypothetical protein n=1 Tax=unclassified Lelliottia TaxID=2642424 RepID=UPI0013046567|nr:MULTISPECIES: hypothetical protein [unclassified Lelliottia]